MDNMISMSDYPNFGNGFGIASPSDVENLSKALNAGDYQQINGVNAQINGAALQVESLDNSLKVLTYSADNIKFWKKISKSRAYATVEEYNQLLSYGEPTGGFILDGELPETQDSEYRRQASLVKFLGTTREVTHAMTLVRSAHDDVITMENRNGINWILRQLEHNLFWGDSKLAAYGPDGKPSEGAQFDGLDTLIPFDNTIDLKGRDMEEKDINEGANMIMENYGTPTDIFLPLEVMNKLTTQFYEKERVILSAPEGGLRAGMTLSKFQTYGGSVDFNPDLFLQRTKPLTLKGLGRPEAPTAPTKVVVALADETDAEFAKSGEGTYAYSATLCNRHGESLPMDADSDIALTKEDLEKGVKITVHNSGAMVNPPEWINIYRTEPNGKQKFLIMRVPAKKTNAGGSTTCVDKNITMANTYTAFMGELRPETITFKQLAPLMKMDLAQLGPKFRWMILLYGTPVLYAPRRWMRFRNIKADGIGHENGLYYSS